MLSSLYATRRQTAHPPRPTRTSQLQHNKRIVSISSLDQISNSIFPQEPPIVCMYQYKEHLARSSRSRADRLVRTGPHLICIKVRLGS